jgi:hypothetical protein
MPLTNIDFRKELLNILPAIYRYRDSQDLDRYLSGCAVLLDQTYHTLVQLRADHFPDDPAEDGLKDGELTCQGWLLPYFAQLLDVKLVSPSVQARRAEVSHAIAWRQRKGTVTVIEQIAEAIAQTEVVVQEGWRRIAMTPRLERGAYLEKLKGVALKSPYQYRPLLPARSFGYTGEPSPYPGLMARHPALPAVTVDFRCPSRRVSVDGAAHGVEASRQNSRHGIPCFPDSNEDVSRRTVDFRNPDWRRGYAHPRRITLYSPPPTGFFADGRIVSIRWSPPSGLSEHVETLQDPSTPDVTLYRPKGYDPACPLPLPIRISGKILLDSGEADTGNRHMFRFIGLAADSITVKRGRLELEKCAVRDVWVQSKDLDKPVLVARDCLLRTLRAPSGLSQLEYCTVFSKVVSESLRASDCIFLGPLQRNINSSLPPFGCLRYSRIEQSQLLIRTLSVHRITRDAVIMHNKTFGQSISDAFGETCEGVLHPATSETVCFGAEDGGEMGAYHDQHHCLSRRAVCEKLKEFLPLGMEPIWITDRRLLEDPLRI